MVRGPIWEMFLTIWVMIVVLLMQLHHAETSAMIFLTMRTQMRTFLFLNQRLPEKSLMLTSQTHKNVSRLMLNGKQIDFHYKMVCHSWRGVLQSRAIIWLNNWLLINIILMTIRWMRAYQILQKRQIDNRLGKWWAFFMILRWKKKMQRVAISRLVRAR